MHDRRSTNSYCSVLNLLVRVLNKSHFNGQVVDELPLADVLSSKGNYRPFFLAKEPLIFERREKKLEETTGTVILDDDGTSDKKQAAFEHPAKKHNFKN